MSVKAYFYQNDIGHVYHGIGFFFVESVDIVVKFCVPCYTYVIVVRVVLFIHTPCDVCCVSVLPIHQSVNFGRHLTEILSPFEISYQIFIHTLPYLYLSFRNLPYQNCPFRNLTLPISFFKY